MHPTTFAAFQDELLKIAVVDPATHAREIAQVEEMANKMISERRAAGKGAASTMHTPIEAGGNTRAMATPQHPAFMPTPKTEVDPTRLSRTSRAASTVATHSPVSVPHPSALPHPAVPGGMGKALGGFARTHGRGMAIGAWLVGTGALALHAMRKPNAAPR